MIYHRIQLQDVLSEEKWKNDRAFCCDSTSEPQARATFKSKLCTQAKTLLKIHSDADSSGTSPQGQTSHPSRRTLRNVRQDRPSRRAGPPCGPMALSLQARVAHARHEISSSPEFRAHIPIKPIAAINQQLARNWCFSLQRVSSKHLT